MQIKGNPHFLLNIISKKSLTRDSLLEELKATKEVLISSLNTVDHLGIEADKVPKLEARIIELEHR